MDQLTDHSGQAYAEITLALAVHAARESLIASGIPDPQVIVTAAWSTGHEFGVMANRPPDKLRNLLADNLRWSAEQCEAKS